MPCPLSGNAFLLPFVTKTPPLFFLLCFCACDVSIETWQMWGSGRAGFLIANPLKGGMPKKERRQTSTFVTLHNDTYARTASK